MPFVRRDDAASVPYTMDDLARDLVGVLDSLEVAAAIICGISVGGLIARGVAPAYPE